MRSKDTNQFDTDPPPSTPIEPRDGDREIEPGACAHKGNLASRRAVIREGAKLAFVAPLLSTFLASQAYAAHYQFSCYPTGHVCPGGNEACCNGACSGGQCP